MVNKLIRILVKTMVLFAVVSFSSVIISLLSRKGNEQPTTKIGFPLNYYNQFWVGENDLHWEWDIKNFLIDSLILVLIVFIVDQMQFFKSNKK